MFKKITLKNFRTHTDTTLELGAITLLFGTNNAGKSNLFAGIRHFSKLIARAEPGKDESGRKLNAGDFFQHRHNLASNNAPISFSCEWTHKLGKVEYLIELYENSNFTPQNVGCRERIQVYNGSKQPLIKEIGGDKPIDTISL